MTTSQSRNLRKAGAVALSLALAMSTLAITPASAAKKVKLAKTKITVNVGKTKTVKIKNVKKKQVKKLTVKSSKAAVAKAKASKKTAIKVTGKKKGSAKVTANLKLKKKVGGKKAYKLTLKVTVKKAAATPTAAPTVAPTAAPTPVVSGASITLDKPAGYTCSVNGADVTITANILPATSNEEVTWSVADSTIASVSGSGATVNGVATATLKGLKEGKTSVSAKIAAMTASAMVTVEKEKIFVKITDVKQTKANEVVVSFNGDARKDNQGFAKGKFDIDVKNDKGVVTRTIPVNKCTVDTVSGTSATLVLDQPFANNDKVTANLYKGTDMASSFDFIASVGDPASVGITKTEYQKDVEEKVEFAVYDAKGVDVTSAVANLDARVKLSVSSDLPGTSNLQIASTATVTMNKVGGSATLTIEYTSATNTTGKADFTNSAVITCIEPKPVVGTQHFQKTENVKTWGTDDTTGTAGFYRGKDLEAITVDAECTFKVSFYAADEDGNAISYDSYAVTSSNGDKMSASIEAGESGKYTNILISGVSQGTATLNVTATKNTKPVPYAIPVTVRSAASKIGSFSLTTNRAKPSNAFDIDYQGENKITPKLTDVNGNDITKDAKYSYEITKPAAADLAGRTVTYDNGTSKAISTTTTKFQLTGSPDGDGVQKFTAFGAKATTYTITARAEWGSDVKEATCTVQVQNVPDACFTTGAGYKIKYQVDGTKDLEIKENKTVDGTAKLAAYAGSVFAGYVKNDGTIGTGTTEAQFGTSAANFVTSGKAKATKDTTIVNGEVYSMVQAGAKWCTSKVANVNLYNREGNFTGQKFATGDALKAGTIKYTAFTAKADAIFYSNEKLDTDVAKKGSYRVEFQYMLNDGKKAYTKADLDVNVKNSLFIPTVSVENRTVETLDETNIKDAMKTNCDLNCNSSNNWSIKGIFGQYDKSASGHHKSLDLTKKSVSVSYVSVSEGGFTMMIPIDAAFNSID